MTDAMVNPAVQADASGSQAPQHAGLGSYSPYPKQYAGQKRKRIDFVPATRDASPMNGAPGSTRSSELYCAIVSQPASEDQNVNASAEVPTVGLALSVPLTAGVPCPVCGVNFPFDAYFETLAAHEASIAHQASLSHVDPPSAIDRQSKGFAYMMSHGWDPDKRIGLGARGEGRLDPVRAIEKTGKAGIGAVVDASKKVARPKKEPDRPMKSLSKAEKRLYNKVANKQRLTKVEKAMLNNIEKPALGKGQKKRAEKAKIKKDKKWEALIMGREDVNNYTGVIL